MRRVKGYIQIAAPVDRVRKLAGSGSIQWMVPRNGLLAPSRTATWNATESEGGGTRFTLQMESRSRLAFLDSFAAGGLRRSVAESLSRLKQLAEHETGDS